MALKTRKLAATAAMAAAFSLLATPAAAIDLPRPSAAKAYDGEAQNAERHRRRYRDRDGIDAGDVVAGVLILGAIAAIAGAGKNNRERERYEESYPRPDEDTGYRTPGQYERSDSRGIDRAVDMCVGEVERGSERVGTVDSATRSADGWRVSGELEGGAPYSCSIGNDGQIGDVFVGDREVASAPSADGQWDDEVYAKARADQRGVDPVDGDLDDDRYETARAPDFSE
jgi:hypothetical protein